MINQSFYKANQLVSLYLGGKVQHYTSRELAIVLESYEYLVQAGDTMYTLAKKIFGEDQEFQWTYIADINFLRQPDDLQPGETILLPRIILSELRYQKPNYAKTPSATAKI